MVTDTPRQGDLIWLNFSPQAGHEQGGRRPALVLSATAYNAKVGLALCCPITSQVKGYTFEVELPADGLINGVVMADQIKNIDWKVRQAERIGAAPEEVLSEVMRKLRALLPDWD